MASPWIPGGEHLKLYIYIMYVTNIDTIYLNTMNVYLDTIHISYIYIFIHTYIYLKRPETHIVSASTMISFNHCKRGGLMFFCRPRSGEKQQANIDPTKKSRKPSFATIYWKGGQPKSRWWFQMFYMFTLIPGEMIQVDYIICFIHGFKLNHHLDSIFTRY